MKYKLLLLSGSLLLNQNLYADMTSEVKAIQSQWAEVNYMPDSDAKQKAFEQLAKTATQITLNKHNLPEALVWEGIVYSSYAGAKGGIGALGLAKKARKSYEAAIALDGDVLDGSAYTSLGVLYYKVPGWPLGFGSDKKAQDYLEKGLVLNPDGIDSNYFYAEFLYEEKDDLNQAKKHLIKAAAAKSRPERRTADSGRQQDIKLLMLVIDKELNN